MREIDTRLHSPSSCRMQDFLDFVAYELHLGPPWTITQFVGQESMQQIDRNMTQVEGPETKQTKLSLKVINLSSHRLHVKFEHQLQSQSPRRSFLCVVHVVVLVVLVRLHVDVYICLLSLRALYCFIMSLGVFIVSMSLSLDVLPCCSSCISCCCRCYCEFHVMWSAIYAGRSVEFCNVFRLVYIELHFLPA